MATSPRTRRKTPAATEPDAGPATTAKAGAETAAATAAKSVARKTPARKSPARKSPAGKSPVRKSPAGKSSQRAAPAAAPQPAEEATPAPNPPAKRRAKAPRKHAVTPPDAAAAAAVAADLAAEVPDAAPADAVATPAAAPATAATETTPPARPTPAAKSARPRKAAALRTVTAAEPAPETPTEPPRQPQAPRTQGKKAAPAARPVEDTAQAVLALLEAPPAPPAPDQTPPPQRQPIPAPSGPAHSAITLEGGNHRQLLWHPGHACPDNLLQAAAQHVDASSRLSPEDDAALPQLLRLASEARHELRVDDAVWAHLAAHRDARHRLATLASAYPDGPASAALARLLRVPLALFQAEGALFAVVAGRALIADERGLGKSVQAIAAARLWRRHFGVQRVLLLCTPANRLAWQRAWQRFDPAGDGAAQLIDGSLHQRSARWSDAAGVRIVSPDTLDSDAAHIAHWAPDLVIVDEPQRLGLRAEAWAQLAAPHALVLCGAPLAEQPALMDRLVDWLDPQRLGPLAALRELHAASDAGRALGDDEVERLTASLSRLMLQRLRADVAEQLPPLVHSERLLPLAPGQREQHDQHAAAARRVLAGWQASGYCSDTDQWRLASSLQQLQRACHRADPTDPASALADATVQAVASQLDDWATTGPVRAALRCDSEADRRQLALRLADGLQPVASGDGDDAPAPLLLLLGPDDALPAGLDAVLQIGVPWRPRRQPAGPRGSAAPGQQWIYLVAQASIECGLFDTLAQRAELPCGLADGRARDYLQGEPLAAWLAAWAAALAATPPATAAN